MARRVGDYAVAYSTPITEDAGRRDVLVVNLTATEWGGGRVIFQQYCIVSEPRGRTTGLATVGAARRTPQWSTQPFPHD